jgi:hypothetical protein
MIKIKTLTQQTLSKKMLMGPTLAMSLPVIDDAHQAMWTQAKFEIGFKK